MTKLRAVAIRFQPWYREIRRLIDLGAIGDTLHGLSFRARPGDGWGDDAYLARQRCFRDMPRLLIYETGVHFIDTFRYLAGEVDEVYAILNRWNSVIRGEDSALVAFRFAAGASGVWDASRYNEGTDAGPRCTFGQMLVEGNGGAIRLYGDGRLAIQKLEEVTEVHKILLGGGVVTVEGLAHLDQLTCKTVEFIALPLKICGSDGCPVRAVVMVEA